MITESTAQRITEVYDEMENCKLAIHLMKKEIESAGRPEIFITVAANENDEGITIPLTPENAQEAIKKQLGALEAEQKALNNLARNELKA